MWWLRLCVLVGQEVWVPGVGEHAATRWPSTCHSWRNTKVCQSQHWRQIASIKWEWQCRQCCWQWLIDSADRLCVSWSQLQWRHLPTSAQYTRAGQRSPICWCHHYDHAPAGQVSLVTSSICCCLHLLLARYLPNVVKRNVCHQCK